MWKSLRSHNKSARVPIGEPILEQTTLDTHSYSPDALSPVAGKQPKELPWEDKIRSRIVNAGPEGPPPRYPPVPPPINSSGRGQHTRKPSSVYSQPSPTYMIPRKVAPMPPSTYHDEVSPPSSPEYGNDSDYNRYSRREASASPDISPIDEMPDVASLHLSRPASSQYKSSIPQSRREKRNQAAMSRAIPKKMRSIDHLRNTGEPQRDLNKTRSIDHLRNTGETRYDSYTGNTMKSERGKPASMNPRNYTAPVDDIYRGVPKMGVHTEITAESPPYQPSKPAQRSYMDRFRTGVRAASANAETRPTWKGASGRQQLMTPPAERLDLPPLRMPKRPALNTRAPVNLPESPHSSGDETPIDTIKENAASFFPDFPIGGRSESPEELDLPPLPLLKKEVAKNEPTRNYTPPTTSESKRPTPIQASTIPAGEKKHAIASPLFPNSTSAIERNFRAALDSLPSQTMRPNNLQPASRFSTSTVDPSTPRVVSSGYPYGSQYNNSSTYVPYVPDHNDIPENSAPIIEPTVPVSVLNRKRPNFNQDPTINNMKATTRKAVQSSTPVKISLKGSVPFSPPKNSEKQKELPGTPEERERMRLDLVSSLEAQASELIKKRENLEREIKAMTQGVDVSSRLGFDAGGRPAPVGMGSYAGSSYEKSIYAGSYAGSSYAKSTYAGVGMTMDNKSATRVDREADVLRKRQAEKRRLEELKGEVDECRKEEHEVGMRLVRARRRRDDRAVFEPTSLWVRRVTD